MRGELETEQRLQHIDPPAPPDIAVCPFSFSLAAHPGPEGPALCWELVPTASNWNTEFKTLISNWLELPLHRVILLFYAHSIQPLDSQGRPLISSTGCTCYLHWCISSFDSLAGSEVNIQHLHLLLSTQLTADLTPEWNGGFMIYPPLSYIHAKFPLLRWNSRKQRFERSTRCCF